MDSTDTTAHLEVLMLTLKAMMAELPGDARARVIAAIQHDLAQSQQPLPEPVDAAAAAALGRLLGHPLADRPGASLLG